MATYLYATLFTFVAGIECSIITKCGTLSPVLEGEPSKIICDFGYDLSVNRTGFSIDHHIEDTFTSEQVLDCNFPDTREIQSPHCQTGEGYLFNKEYGGLVTLDIPRTSKHQGGKYTCRSLTEEFQKNLVCLLNVKFSVDSAGVRKTSCRTNTPVLEGETALVKCLFSEDPRKKKHYFSVLKYMDSKTLVSEAVMNCVWHTGQSKPTCHTHRGYSPNYSQGKELTLTIANASLQHAGIYACDDFLALPAQMNSCTLAVITDISAESTRAEPTTVKAVGSVNIDQPIIISAIPPHFGYVLLGAIGCVFLTLVCLGICAAVFFGRRDVVGVLAGQHRPAVTPPAPHTFRRRAPDAVMFHVQPAGQGHRDSFISVHDDDYEEIPNNLDSGTTDYAEPDDNSSSMSGSCFLDNRLHSIAFPSSESSSCDDYLHPISS